MRGETFVIPINKITVPEGRTRTNQADIDGLNIGSISTSGDRTPTRGERR